MKTVVVACLLPFFSTTCFSAIKGDMNDDGEVDIADALIVLRTAIGVEPKISIPVPIQPVCPAPVVCPAPIVCPSQTICPAATICPTPIVCPAPTVCTPTTIIIKDSTTCRTPTAGYPKIVKSIPFPAGVTYFSDLAFDRVNNTAWLLAGNDTGQPKWLVHIATDGTVLGTNAYVNTTWSVNYGSFLASNGVSIWATSYGWLNGIPITKVYSLDTSGNVLKEIPCPATTAGGFCTGITWDGSKFWTVASDSKDLVSFFPDGTISAKFIGIFPEVSRSRNLFYDWAKSRLVASDKTYLDVIDTSTGIRTRTFPYNNGVNGDWDGQYFWNINTSTLQIEIMDLGI
jgi:hypothetical protein